MHEVLVALASAAITAAAAAGVGSLACAGASSWPAGQRWILRLVLGLGLLPLLLVAAHEVLRAPVRPLVAVGLGAAGLVVAAAQERRWGPSSGSGTLDLALALVLAAGLFFTALAGLLRQPGFEVLDPWRHSLGAAWVADSGVLRQPDPTFPLIQYVDAYPPLFDVLLAVPVGLLRANPPAVKGVAALLVAVAPLALWLLARCAWKDRRRAACATVLYAVLPSAVPRHVWGHSLAVILMLGGLAAVLELRRDRRWGPAAALAFGATALAAPSQGIKAFALLGVTTLVAAVVDRRWMMRVVGAGAGAGIVAALWLVPAAARAGFEPVQLVRNMQPPELRRADDPVTALEPGQEAPLPWARKPHDRMGLRHVLLLRSLPPVASAESPVLRSAILPPGLGLPLVVLVIAGLAGLLRRPRDPTRWVAASWLAVAALLTFGAPLGVILFPWRSWLLLAPTVALVAADGAARLAAVRMPWLMLAVIVAIVHAAAAVVYELSHGRLFSHLATPAWLVVVGAAAVWALRTTRDVPDRRTRAAVAAVLLCHLVVASPVRASALLGELPPKVFYDAVEHRSYLELAARVAPGERVWPLSGGMRFDIVTGLGLRCTPYHEGELEMARQCTRGHPPPARELVPWLREAGYRWLVLDPSCDELLSARGDPDGFARLLVDLEAHPGLRPALKARATQDAPEPRFVVWEVVDDAH